MQSMTGLNCKQFSYVSEALFHLTTECHCCMYLKKAPAQPKPVDEAAAAAPSRTHAACRRPKRAAAASIKRYRDPDTDESLSETEETHASKAKDVCDLFI